MNAVKQNIEAIDLIDINNKIIIQVSATATKQKIDSTLGKDLSLYKGFKFKFISISKDASDLRTKTFSNPHNLKFIAKNDIYDITSILNIIGAMAIVDQKEVYEFIKKELGSEIDTVKVETNLASIINVLASENWDPGLSKPEINPYEISRKIDYNNLSKAISIIDDYKIWHTRLDKIYLEFDKSGNNKSNSVLDSIRKEYIVNLSELDDDVLFFKIIDSVLIKIQQSKNYQVIPYDELELCVNILTVDAFIRCKIFKNPAGYHHVAP